MMRQKHNNKGFSLVELLISMALLSIIMLMVVQFMATTTGANKKAKANMKAQTASEEFVGNIFDSMSMANYIRITPYKGIYKQNIGSRKEALKASPISSVSVDGTFDFVPDSYGQYVQPASSTEKRKVIVDFDTYKLYSDKNTLPYPLDDSSELDNDTTDKISVTRLGEGGSVTFNKDVRSFRMLKASSGTSVSYVYIKPRYIYVEYNKHKAAETDTEPTLTDSIIYRFDYSQADGGGECTGVYIYRQLNVSLTTANRYRTAIQAVEKYGEGATNKLENLLTNSVYDFYVSADAEGNSLMVDCLTKGDNKVGNSGVRYYYNNKSSVSFRNSNLLTAQPRNSFKTKGSIIEQPESSSEVPSTDESGGASGEDTPETP